ncbi:hypothetical protein C2869_11100 [Saccharobesus litoralis]|uniref:Spermidine synthase n=1 Tax=Saccharobesus litoralis TaxID=2172099 RepID=A0A2S0VRW8_9ALTE|nr:hypothetical protein [Saccharobesus litoralis]AWB66949.1 hypothetical protein C2869_11100 [Saccharobesus litoralis]
MSFNPEQLISISQQNEYCLATFKSYSIHQWHNWRWLYHASGTLLSVMDLTHPEQLSADYQWAMLAGWQLANNNDNHTQNQAKVLNLGMGLAGFERFFANVKVAVDSVEIDTELVNIARQYFELSPTHPVIIEDAANLVAKLPKPKIPQASHYDLILGDLFANSQVPSCLLKPEFYKDLACLINDNAGYLALNTLVDQQQDLLNIMQAIRQHFAHQVILDINGCKNIVILARQQTFCQQQLKQNFQALTQSVTLAPDTKKALQTSICNAHYL